MLTFFFFNWKCKISEELSLLSCPGAILISYYCLGRGEEKTAFQTRLLAFWQRLSESVKSCMLLDMALSSLGIYPTHGDCGCIQLHALCYGGGGRVHTATCSLLGAGEWKLSQCLREGNSSNALHYANTSVFTMQLFKIDDLQREFQINSLPRTPIDWQSLLGTLSWEGLRSQGQAQHQGGWCDQGGAFWEESDQ